MYPLEISAWVGTVAGCWHCLADARSFVIGEEEGLVLDGSARRWWRRTDSGGTRLFRSGSILEEIGRIQCVVAEELPEAAMELVGSGFQLAFNTAPPARPNSALNEFVCSLNSPMASIGGLST